MPVIALNLYKRDYPTEALKWLVAATLFVAVGGMVSLPLLSSANATVQFVLPPGVKPCDPGLWGCLLCLGNEALFIGGTLSWIFFPPTGPIILILIGGTGAVGSIVQGYVKGAC